MSQTDTVRGGKRTLCVVAAVVCLAAAAYGQERVPGWRKVGNTSLLLGLPSPAAGPVERAWFSPDGESLTVRTFSGKLFQTKDFESWQPVAGPPATAAMEPDGTRRPQPDARLRSAGPRSAMVYAFAQDVWRSEDGGGSWANVTGAKGASILGGAPIDLAVSPVDERRIVAVNAYGVWFSVDGGGVWTGLNDGLPSLPVRRILSAPSGVRGARVLVERVAGVAEPYEWAPGQRIGWIPSREPQLQTEDELRRSVSIAAGEAATAAAAGSGYQYAGTAGGRLWSSADDGVSWRAFGVDGGGAVERIWVDPGEPRTALAVLRTGGARVLRTLNGGAWWDDITADLPEGDVYGVTAERASGAVYAATSRGVFWTTGDLMAPSQATPWAALSKGLPEGAARDVRLDGSGYQLYAAMDGYGLYATAAPHRTRLPLLLHSADYGRRAAAPGDLLSVVGAPVDAATASGRSAVVLSAAAPESQIQLPFGLTAGRQQLVVTGNGRTLTFPLDVRVASPAILVDREGSAVLLDAETGVQIDALNPARPGSRVQILAAGLGRVTPEWPAGTPAPLEGPPRVVATLRALFDGVPAEVTRATLAPGYIGYYLVEVQMPELLNSGGAELLLEAAGQSSNPVRIYLSHD